MISIYDSTLQCRVVPPAGLYVWYQSCGQLGEDFYEVRGCTGHIYSSFEIDFFCKWIVRPNFAHN